MAKSKGQPNDPPDTPSNTTSGGKPPESAGDQPATTEGDKPQGTAHYPPSPGDGAGEKTDNIPPAKELPADVPPQESGADETSVLKAEHAALCKVVTSLGGNPQAVCEEARRQVRGAGAPNRGPTRKATVTPVNGSPVDVEFAADAPDPHTAAVEAYKAKAGLWALPQQPAVQHHD